MKRRAGKQAEVQAECRHTAETSRHIVQVTAA